MIAFISNLNATPKPTASAIVRGPLSGLTPISRQGVPDRQAQASARCRAARDRHACKHDDQHRENADRPEFAQALGRRVGLSTSSIHRWQAAYATALGRYAIPRRLILYSVIFRVMVLR